MDLASDTTANIDAAYAWAEEGEKEREIWRVRGNRRRNNGKHLMTEVNVQETIPLSARLLVRLSNLFKAADRTRYGSGDAYARWQFSTAQWEWPRVQGRCLDLQGQSVADLGCGSGGKTLFYATLGPKRVVGVDCDEEKVASAQRLLAATRRRVQNCDFRVGWAEATGLERGAFDIAISEDGFEHFPNPDGVIDEAQALLREGGLFLILLTTYWTPSGPHLYNFIRLPRAHLMFSRPAMVAAVRVIAKRMEERTDLKIRTPMSRSERLENEMKQLDQFIFALPEISQLFDWGALTEAAVARSAELDEAADPHSLGETPMEQAERELAQLAGYINGMSLKRFKAILAEHDGWELVGFHRYVHNWRHAPFVLFRNMPVLDELQGSLVFLLRKATGKQIRPADFRSPGTRMNIERVLR